MRIIAEDMNGKSLYIGDKVMDEHGIIHIIELGNHREKFDCGYVVGYFIPDFAVKIENENTKQ